MITNIKPDNFATESLPKELVYCVIVRSSLFLVEQFLTVTFPHELYIVIINVFNVLPYKICTKTIY